MVTFFIENTVLGDHVMTCHSFSVISKEQDHGVLTLAAFIQSIQDLTNLLICHGKIVVVSVEIILVIQWCPVGGVAQPAVCAAQILDKFRTVFQIIKIEVLRKRRKFTVKFKILRMTSITHLTDITTDVVWILDISDC